jgi:glycosyltransferase involved in cell wall biosynthesis
MQDPKVSVIMPVHNGTNYVREAIASILSQSFTDFEFLILDDASTDHTWDVVNSFDDPRITCYRNAENLGVSQTMNKALKLSKGIYYARFDHDDLCAPERLELQAALLDTHPDIHIVGSAVRMFGDGNGDVQLPASDDQIKAYFVTGMNNISHGASMIRSTFVRDNHLVYNPVIRCEDFDFWLSCTKAGARFANLPEVLLHYRLHLENSSNTVWERLGREAHIIRQGFLGLYYDTLSFKTVRLIAEMFTGKWPMTIKSCHTYMEAVGMAVDRPQADYGQNKARVEELLQERLLVVLTAYRDAGVINNDHIRMARQAFPNLYRCLDPFIA